MHSPRLTEPAKISVWSILRFHWWPALLAALAACSALWLNSDAFPSGTNVYHLPIVLDYADSLEGPHDPFTRSLGNYVSVLWPALATIATESNVRFLFLLLLVATAVLTVLGGYAMAVAAGARPTIAAIGCGVLAFGFAGREFMEFGTGDLFAGYFTHSQVATAVGLFALAFAIRQRWCWGALICGIAADMNLFLGFWLMTNLLLARVTFDWRNHRRPDPASYARMVGLCLLPAAPVIIWALQSHARSSAEFSFTEYLYIYYPYHSFIHLEVWLFLAFAALQMAVWYGLSQDTESRAEPLPVLAMTAVITIVIGAVAVYIVDHRMIQNLYPLRYAALAHWIAAIGVLVLWSRAEESGSGKAIFGAVAVLGFMLPTPAITLAALLFLLDSSQMRLHERWVLLVGLGVSLIVPAFSEGYVAFPELTRTGAFAVLPIVGVGASILVSLLKTRLAVDRWLFVVVLWLAASSTTVGDKATAVTIAVLLVSAVAIISADRRRPAAMFCCAVGATLLICHVSSTGFSNWTAIGSLLLMLLPPAAAMAFPSFSSPGSASSTLPRRWSSSAVLGPCVVMLSVVGVTQAAKRGFDFPRWPTHDDWYDAQSWARENTPPDTVFYAPGLLGFSVLSRRPVWYDENEGAAVMWVPPLFAEWNGRRLLAEAANTLTDVVVLARSEGVRFLVVKRNSFDGEVVPGLTRSYCNSEYCIAEVVSI
ncbi:MAG: hypothetical protein ABI859_10470 [Pseudomonadota bacterium]